jgi:sulfoxide reductase heme-binding subunit YedZ
MSVRLLKPVVFLLGLLPLLSLIWRGYNGDLTANPFEEITRNTGRWILKFLFLTLAISPLRQITGWNALIRYRRMLGLFAFFYAFLHFLIYLVLYHVFNFAAILDDIAMRPFITMGFAAFVMLIPLAITSTKKWVVRLGGKRWQLLHRLIYISALAGVIHYWWGVKLDLTWPIIYAIGLAILLGFRIVTVYTRRKATLTDVAARRQADLPS